MVKLSSVWIAKIRMDQYRILKVLWQPLDSWKRKTMGKCWALARDLPPKGNHKISLAQEHNSEYYWRNLRRSISPEKMTKLYLSQLKEPLISLNCKMMYKNKSKWRVSHHATWTLTMERKEWMHLTHKKRWTRVKQRFPTKRPQTLLLSYPPLRELKWERFLLKVMLSKIHKVELTKEENLRKPKWVIPSRCH
jgi:hypothetical protein